MQTSDNQAGAENTSAEASRRSSTSTQNTDTLTPTNISSDPTDNQETVVSAVSADMVVEAHHNIQDDASNSKSYQSFTTHAQTQIQDTTVNANHVNVEASKESQELQDVVDMKDREMTKEMSASDVAAELSTLPVPTPARKISRFLVSPVVEQKTVASEEEAPVVNENADRTNITISQPTSQSVLNTANVESVPKNEDHAEANVLEGQAAAVHEQISGNIEPMAQGVQYAVEQADNTQQQVLQQGQQSIGVQNVIQMQTLQQQMTGHVQQTIGQTKQHTIIVQGTTITSQQTPQQQMPPTTGMQNFVSIGSQKELQSQSLHTNGIAQQTQYQNQAIVQSGIVIQQQQPPPPQQIPIQQSVMQPHMQAEHQLQGQMQVQRPSVQQFVPQQVQPPTQQYVMLSGHIQPIQSASIDERNRRIPNTSTNVSMDSQILESSSISEEKRQTMAAVNTPMTHMQHVQVVPQDMSSGMPPLSQGVVDTAQQFQIAHQNVQYVPGVVPSSVSQVPLPVHPIVAADVTTPKVVIKAKEVSSTLPDLAQNLANILSNPKSKSTTPHPLTSHEPAATAAPNVAASTLVEHKPVQSEQYFQPIQPEVSQLQAIQPPVQHNYQGQIVYQGYQGQPNFQQAFPNQQLLHQGQMQTIPQSIPLMIPQQIDAHSQMIQSTLQNVSAQLSAQGKWIVSNNQAPQPMRHVQSNQAQPLHNQSQLQQIPVQLQMQQQTMQDQQYSESPIVTDQSQLQLKLSEQHTARNSLETETLESSNLDWYVRLLYPHFIKCIKTT